MHPHTQHCALLQGNDCFSQPLQVCGWCSPTPTAPRSFNLLLPAHPSEHTRVSESAQARPEGKTRPTGMGEAKEALRVPHSPTCAPWNPARPPAAPRADLQRCLQPWNDFLCLLPIPWGFQIHQKRMAKPCSPRHVLLPCKAAGGT